MQITYYLEDGYAGSKSRPHYVEVNDEEIGECENESEFNDLIDQYVQDDFQSSISTFYTRPKWPGKSTQFNDDEE